MISQEIKNVFYAAMRLPMRVNGLIYKAVRAPTSGTVKVHLGPGRSNYIEGWVNLDANFVSARVDVWADLTNPLPFRDGTVTAFYSHHVIEHLSDPTLERLFKEMFRCLVPGGIIRVGGPDGDTAIRKFVENDTAWFSNWPDARRSIGGRFANFIFCRGQHTTMLSRSYLTELAIDSNFVNVSFCLPASETRYPAIVDQLVLGKEQESTPEAPHTLIMEAMKPIASTN